MKPGTAPTTSSSIVPANPYSVPPRTPVPHYHNVLGYSPDGATLATTGTVVRIDPPTVMIMPPQMHLKSPPSEPLHHQPYSAAVDSVAGFVGAVLVEIEDMFGQTRRRDAPGQQASGKADERGVC